MRRNCHNLCPFYMSLYRGPVSLAAHDQQPSSPGSWGLAIQVRLLDHMASKALLTKNKDLLSTKTHVGCRAREAA